MHQTEINTREIAEFVDLPTFLRIASAQDIRLYLRVFIDREERVMTVFTPADDESYVAVEIPNTKFRVFDLPTGMDLPVRYDLHWSQAFNMLSFLETLKNAGGDPRVDVEYCYTNNSQIFDGTDLFRETIMLKWTNDARTFRVDLDDIHKHQSTRMANWS